MPNIAERKIKLKLCELPASKQRQFPSNLCSTDIKTSLVVVYLIKQVLVLTMKILWLPEGILKNS